MSHIKYLDATVQMFSLFVTNIIANLNLTINYYTTLLIVNELLNYLLHTSYRYVKYICLPENNSLELNILVSIIHSSPYYS